MTMTLPGHRHNRRGWTLVELAVVLAIVALAVAWVTPRVSGLLAPARLDSATARLRDAWLLAQALAELRGVAIEVTYTGRAMELRPLDDTHDEPPIAFRLPEGVRFREVRQGEERWQLRRGPVRWLLRPNGPCPPHEVVVIDDARGRQRVLQVPALAGEIKRLAEAGVR